MQAVSDQAVGVGVTRGVKPDQQLVKVTSFSRYTKIEFSCSLQWKAR